MRTDKAKKRQGYIGTYTQKEGHVDGKAKGFYGVQVDRKTGSLSLTNTFDGVVNPSYLCLSRDKQNLYVVEEDNPGRVVAFAIDDEGDMIRLSSHDTGSAASCHVNTSHKDDFVVTSNYVGGLFNIYRRDAYGGLIPHQRLDFQPETGDANSHAHSAFFSSNDRFLFLIDLGLDAIWVYQKDEGGGTFVPAAKHRVQLPNGSGPRHFCLHSNEHSAYLVNEYGNSVTHFNYDKKTGTLSQREELSTLPRGFSGQNSCADLRIHPTGHWLYASNRGHDSLALFAVAPDGQLTFRETYSSGGAFPRAFTLDEKGKYLYVANQNADNIVQFAIDQRSGSLTKVGELSVPTPVCIDLV